MDHRPGGRRRLRGVRRRRASGRRRGRGPGHAREGTRRRSHGRDARAEAGGPARPGTPSDGHPGHGTPGNRPAARRAARGEAGGVPEAVRRAHRPVLSPEAPLLPAAAVRLRQGGDRAGRGHRAHPHRHRQGRVPRGLRDAPARRGLGRLGHRRREHQPVAELRAAVPGAAAHALLRRSPRADAEQGGGAARQERLVSLLAIALKDLRLIARDRAAVLFTLLVPIVVITIVAETLGGHDGGSILLPVVNEDEGPGAEVLTETLRKHVDVVQVDRPRAEALVGVEKRAAAALVLPERLSKRYLGGQSSTLTLLTDPAKGTEVDTVKAYLMLADTEAAALADPLSEKLLTLDEHNLTGSRLTTTSFEQNVPGFSVMFVLMSLLFGGAFGLRAELDRGTVSRLRMAPLGRGTLLGGKLLARYAVGVAQMLILFTFGHFAFGVSLGPSVLTFVTLTLVVVFCMTGFSLLVATFARTREQIIPIGLTVVMLVCAVGGCWWPLFMEPSWLQRASHVTPTAWAMDGLSDLILRDRTLGGIAPTLAALLAYGLACLGAGAWLYRLAD